MNQDNKPMSSPGYEIRAYADQVIFTDYRPYVATISYSPRWWHYLIPGKVEKERVKFWKDVDEILEGEKWGRFE